MLEGSQYGILVMVKNNHLFTCISNDLMLYCLVLFVL